MGNFYFRMLMIIFAGFNVNAGKEEIIPNQIAVTSLLGLEDFYVRIKDEMKYTYVDDGELGQLRKADYTGVIPYLKFPLLVNVQHRPVEFEFDWDLEHKSHVCGRIFNSGFYDMQDQVAVEFHLRASETEKYLEQNYKHIYQDIYESYPSVGNKWPNSYKRRIISVGGNEFAEHVFRCLTHERTAKLGTFVEYFISPIYHLPSTEHPVNGRFVFTITEESDKLKVVALAEEPAILDENVIRTAHSAYYNARKHKRKGSDKTANAVCAMSNPDKMRLCAIVLNAKDFPDRIKFWPSEDYIEPMCEEKKIVARGHVDKVTETWFHGVKQSEIDVEMVYNEQMIGCKAILVPEHVTEDAAMPTVASVQQGESPSKSMPDPTIESEKSKSASVTYYIGPALDKFAVIVYKRSTTEEYVPFVGLSKVHLIVESGVVKPVSIVSLSKK